MRSSPSQKFGTDTPTTASAMTTWSTQVFCRTAAIVPRTTPNTTVRPNASAASDSVAGMRSVIAWATVRPSRIESPRFPRRRSAYHRERRTTNGASRPNCSRIPLHLVGGGPDPGHHDGGVARHQVHDTERDEGDEPQHDDRGEQPAGDVPPHRGALGLGGDPPGWPAAFSPAGAATLPLTRTTRSRSDGPPGTA